MIVTKFQDIVDGLDDALTLARSLGVRTQGSRFETYRTRIAAWVQHAAQRTVPDPAVRDDALDSVALTEALELAAAIVPVLKTVAPSIAANKLRRIFKGADRPDSDDKDSADARNVAFEVSLASKFREAGVPIELEEPDLVCWIGRRRVLIACKRPFGPTGVRTNIQRGQVQIRKSRRSSSPRGDGGVIAVSFSRVAIPPGKWLRGRNGDDLDARLARILADAVVKHRGAWHERVDRCSIGGLIFHVNCVAIDESRPRYVLAEQSLFVQLAHSSKPSGRVFRKLAAELQRAKA